MNETDPTSLATWFWSALLVFLALGVVVSAVTRRSRRGRRHRSHRRSSSSRSHRRSDSRDLGNIEDLKY